MNSSMLNVLYLDAQRAQIEGRARSRRLESISRHKGERRTRRWL